MYFQIIALVVGFLIGCGFAFLLRSRVDNWMETSFDTSHDTSVDPWAMQRAIMSASNQDLPACPRLTKGSLLYGALCMEELGETLEALALGMLDARFFPHPSMHKVYLTFRRTGHELQQSAATLRSQIALLPYFEFPMLHRHAVELLDGGTDLVVVAAGLMNATGLPGAAAYEEVSASNLSKRNPDTGVIDKTPDGKWIKGRDYRMPDLSMVLREHAEALHTPFA